MIRFVAILLLLGSPAFADDPTPVDDLSVIVAPKECSGTGKRADPFVFTSGTKCVLRLTGKSATVVFDLEDAPPDAEAIDRVLIFSLAEPGDYLVIATFDGGFAKAWFRIAGPNGPPAPVENSITTRVKAALSGQAEDASKFGAVCSELAKALDDGKIAKQSNFESAMAAGLSGVSWPKGKYGDLTKLTSELFDHSENDWTLTADDKAMFAKHLRTIAAACQGVSK